MAKTSLEARKVADTIMTLGGAWTGTLTTQLLDQEKLNAFNDAIFISDERQYYRLLNNYEGKWFASDEYRMVEMFTLSQRIVKPENIIGKHWVVVLTCHG